VKIGMGTIDSRWARCSRGDESGSKAVEHGRGKGLRMICHWTWWGREVWERWEDEGKEADSTGTE